MATVAEINTKIEDAVTAMEAGDYLTAETKAMAAEALLAVKPDTDFSKEKLLWDREAIARFSERMRKYADKQRLSGKITQIPVRRQSSSCCSASNTCSCSCS